MARGTGRRRGRPCSVCRRWFVPDPRVRGKQRTCLRAECRKEQRRRTQASYRRRNEGEEWESQLRSRVERVWHENNGGNSDACRAERRTWCENPNNKPKDVMPTQLLGIVIFLAKLLCEREKT